MRLRSRRSLRASSSAVSVRIPRSGLAGRERSGVDDPEALTIVTARVRVSDLLLAAEQPLDEVGHCVWSTQCSAVGDGGEVGASAARLESSVRRTLTFGSEG